MRKILASLLPLHARQRGELASHIPALFFLAALLFIPAQLWASEVVAVKSINIKPYNNAIDGFKKAMPGHIKQYTLKQKRAGNGKEELLLLTKNSQIDLIFALGSDALNFAQAEYQNIPIVFSFVLNPDLLMGNDWADTRENIHGISMNIPTTEQLKILKHAAPSVTRVGVVYDPSKTASLITNAKKEAARFGLAIIAKAISSRTEAINAIDSMKGEIDAIWMVPDTTAITMESIKYTLLFSFRNRLPLIGISEKYVKSGALFALSFDSQGIGEQAGTVAMEVLNQTRNSNTSYTRPTKLKLSINIKTAKKIGLNLPGDLIKNADKLY